MPEPDRKQVLTDEVHVSGRPGPGGRLRCVLLFPNEYAVAMPNLGFQTLYRLLNSHPEITCERAFWPPVPDAGARFKTRQCRSRRLRNTFQRSLQARPASLARDRHPAGRLRCRGHIIFLRA